MHIAKLDGVMIALFVADAARDDATLRAGHEDNVTFDHASWEDHHPRTNSAVMTHSAAENYLTDGLQFAVNVRRAHWFLSNQIEVRKGIPRAHKAVAPDDAHLEAGILGDDRVLHNLREIERRPKWKETVVGDAAHHQGAARINGDVVPDRAVVDDYAGADGTVVAD